jgi:hypothetical protein
MIRSLILAAVLLAAGMSLSACMVADGIAHVVKLADHNLSKSDAATPTAPPAAQPAPTAQDTSPAAPPPAPAPRETIRVEELPPHS